LGFAGLAICGKTAEANVGITNIGQNRFEPQRNGTKLI
jgi:hypothetical protein